MYTKLPTFKLKNKRKKVVNVLELARCCCIQGGGTACNQNFKISSKLYVFYEIDTPKLIFYPPKSFFCSSLPLHLKNSSSALSCIFPPKVLEIWIQLLLKFNLCVHLDPFDYVVALLMVYL